MNERTTTIKVTLRHSTDPVTEDDLITAILAMEMWWNTNHEHRIWLNGGDVTNDLPPGTPVELEAKLTESNRYMEEMRGVLAQALKENAELEESLKSTRKDVRYWAQRVEDLTNE